MADYAQNVRDILSKNGCNYVRHGKGDHDIWFSPITNRNVTVDGKINKRSSANKTLAQAGVKERL
jgi:hypothetical protein